MMREIWVVERKECGEWITYETFCGPESERVANMFTVKGSDDWRVVRYIPAPGEEAK